MVSFFDFLILLINICSCAARRWGLDSLLPTEYISYREGFYSFGKCFLLAKNRWPHPEILLYRIIPMISVLAFQPQLIIEDLSGKNLWACGGRPSYVENFPSNIYFLGKKNKSPKEIVRRISTWRRRPPTTTKTKNENNGQIPRETRRVFAHCRFH